MPNQPWWGHAAAPQPARGYAQRSPRAQARAEAIRTLFQTHFPRGGELRDIVALAAREGLLDGLQASSALNVVRAALSSVAGPVHVYIP